MPTVLKLNDTAFEEACSGSGYGYGDGSGSQ